MLRRSERGTGASQRPTLLQQLLRVAGNLQQQAATGDDIKLTTLEISAAERIAKELKEKLLGLALVPLEDVDKLWSNPSQDTSNFLALYFLALRRSSPFAVGSGTPSAFASVRDNLSVHFGSFTTDPIKWQQFCRETMGPLLLKTDTLGCYARLLAEVAAQLQGAAAAALPAQALAAASGPSAGSASASVATRSVGQGVQRQGAQRQPLAPGVQAQRPTAQQVDLHLVYSFLCEVMRVVQPLKATVASEGSDSSIPAAARDDVRAQLQSTCLLEHWARVLLLATAPALAGGSSKQLQAQTQQADLFQRLCSMHSWMQLDLADFVRRPWGCSLAFIHIARLCAALDGECEERYGLPRHAVLVLHAAAALDTEHCVRSHRAAHRIDAGDMQLGQAFSLLPAMMILKAWTSLLGQAFPERPATKAVTGLAAAGLAAAGVGRHGCGAGVQQGQAQVGAEAGSSAQGEEEGAQQTEGAASPCCLPPLNRGATVDMCLRLAKGLLAHWGAVIPGVRVGAANGGRAGDGGRMPRASASAALQFALACARMALLPDVWGRATVRGRTWARLRAWWGTYVAAAQHPGALRLAVPKWATYPSWTDSSPGAFLIVAPCHWGSCSCTSTRTPSSGGTCSADEL